MKYRLLILTFIAPLFMVFAFKGIDSEVVTPVEIDANCLTKTKSEWGGACKNYGNSEDKYTVFLQNDCDEAIDLMVCIQNKNKSWSCFYRNEFASKETMEASVCKGVGKYLKWARKAGDINTEFPTEVEVNETYVD